MMDALTFGKRNFVLYFCLLKKKEEGALQVLNPLLIITLPVTVLLVATIVVVVVVIVTVILTVVVVI